MVKGIEKVSTDLQLLRLCKREVLKDREVQIPNSGRLEGVATAVGKRPIASLNVPGAGINCQVAHGLSISSRERGYGTPLVRISARVDNRAVAGRVTVQVRVVAASHGNLLARFDGKRAGKTNATKHCLGKPV